MKYEYLSQKEINNLKIELMSGVKTKKIIQSKQYTKRDNSIGSYSHRSPSDEYYKHRNEELSKDFEENIRQVLIHDYKWKAGVIARKFSYRDIKINSIIKLIKTNDEITFDIENKKIKFKLDDDNILYMNDEKNNNKEFTSHEEIKDINYGVEIIIGKLIEVEIDGIFQIDNFRISQFDEKEIKILYKNIDKRNDFKHAALEIKYSKTNFGELVEQLERDKQVLEKFIDNADEKFIYIGVIRTNNFHKKELSKYIDNLKKLKCVIIGLNKPIFNKRNIDKYIDWNMIYEKENKFINLENKINGSEKIIGNIVEEKIKNIVQEKISDAFNSFEEKIGIIIQQKISDALNSFEEKFEKKFEEKFEKKFEEKFEKKLNNFKNKILKKVNKKHNQIDRKINSLFRLLNNNNDISNNKGNNNKKSFIGKKGLNRLILLGK